MDATRRLVKAFSDAIPQGDHPEPHSEWINVRLDFVQQAIDHLDWLEHGISEWQGEAVAAQKQADVAGASARVAVRHLRTILNGCSVHHEQQSADTSARDWLASIGQ